MSKAKTETKIVRITIAGRRERECWLPLDVEVPASMSTENIREMLPEWEGFVSDENLEDEFEDQDGCEDAEELFTLSIDNTNFTVPAYRAELVTDADGREQLILTRTEIVRRDSPLKITEIRSIQQSEPKDDARRPEHHQRFTLDELFDWR